MPRGWEGNRRSGVALAMRHGLKWFIQLRLKCLRKGDEHPVYAPVGVWHLYLYIYLIINLGLVLITVQNFTLIGRRISKISR